MYSESMRRYLHQFITHIFTHIRFKTGTLSWDQLPETNQRNLVPYCFMKFQDFLSTPLTGVEDTDVETPPELSFEEHVRFSRWTKVPCSICGRRLDIPRVTCLQIKHEHLPEAGLQYVFHEQCGTKLIQALFGQYSPLLSTTSTNVHDHRSLQ